MPRKKPGITPPSCPPPPELPVLDARELMHGPYLHAHFLLNRIGISEEKERLVSVIQARECIGDLLKAEAPLLAEKYGSPQVFRSKNGEIFVNIGIIDSEKQALSARIRQAIPSYHPPEKMVSETRISRRDEAKLTR